MLERLESRPRVSTQEAMQLAFDVIYRNGRGLRPSTCSTATAAI
jgi:hypothetical protein